MSEYSSENRVANHRRNMISRSQSNGSKHQRYGSLDVLAKQCKQVSKCKLQAGLLYNMAKTIAVTAKYT